MLENAVRVFLAFGKGIAQRVDEECLLDLAKTSSLIIPKRFVGSSRIKEPSSADMAVSLVSFSNPYSKELIGCI